jgi:ketosteroid isomerase-like protein
MTKTFDVETEIRKLSDRAAISDLVLRYFRGVNTSDPKLIASCFTDDAMLVSGGQTMKGRKAIEDYFTDWVRTTGSGGKGVMKRAVSTPYGMNLEITLDGDRASSTSAGMAIHAGTRDDAGMVTVRGTYYRDQFVRTADGWKISDRYHGAHWASEWPAKLVSH